MTSSETVVGNTTIKAQPNGKEKRAMRGGSMSVAMLRDDQRWNFASGGGWSLDLPAPSVGATATARATDLLLAALGYCMGDLVMGYCVTKGYDAKSVTVNLADHPAEGPLRIEEIDLEIEVTGDLADHELRRLEEIVDEYCKIGNTLRLGTRLIKAPIVLSGDRAKRTDRSSRMAEQPSGPSGDGGIRCAC